MQSIIIAEDHSLVLKGLRLVLKSIGVMQTFQVTNRLDLMQSLQEKQFTHLITNINLIDGSIMETLPTIVQLYPSLNIMIFSKQPPALYGRAVEQLGIRHYLHKEASEEDTIIFLQKFLQDEHSAIPNFTQAPDHPFSSLTPREYEILGLMFQGLTTTEMAKKLNLNLNTISTFKSRVFEKTGTQNIIELTKFRMALKRDASTSDEWVDGEF